MIENINKIHYLLTESFGDVSVKEESNREYKEFFSISLVKENKNLKMFITKRELSNNDFNWFYLSNPLDNNSIIERRSSIFSLKNDIDDIFSKNRFDSDYLKTIK
jgi:hypothetical protein